MSNSIFNLSFSILFVLFPISLITGSFLPDFLLCITLLSIIFLKPKIFKIIFFKWYYIIFLIWFIYLLIISVLSDFPILSLSSSLFLFRFMLFIIVFEYFISDNTKFAKLFLFSLIFCFLFLIVDSFFQFLYGFNLFGIENYREDRISSLFRDELKLGSYLSRLLPLLIGLLIYLNYINKKNIILVFVLLILTFITINLSGERASVFYSMLTIIIFLLILKGFFIEKFYFLIFLFLFSIILFLNSSQVYNRVILKTINGFKGADNSFTFISSKIEIFFYSSFSMFQDHPFFGIGPKLYRKYCKYENYEIFDACSTHPHNTYLQLLAETGLFGAMPIILSFFYVSYLLVKYIFKNLTGNISDKQYYSIMFLVSIFISLWPFGTTGNFFNNWLDFIYILPLPFLLLINKNDKY